MELRCIENREMHRFYLFGSKVQTHIFMVLREQRLCISPPDLCNLGAVLCMIRRNRRRVKSNLSTMTLQGSYLNCGIKISGHNRSDAKAGGRWLLVFHPRINNASTRVCAEVAAEMGPLLQDNDWNKMASSHIRDKE